MADPQDTLDLSTRPTAAEPANANTKPGQGKRPWISIWFECCNVYSRIYRDPSATVYQGRCPRCGANVCAKVGPGGTSQRFFRAS